jgi:hypothetical protein
MSPIVKKLLDSDDPVDNELARTLLAWQNAKAGQGKKER